MTAYTITCPKCGHVGTDETFDLSLCDEIECPVCGYCTLLGHEDEDEGG